jgi:hypothetical protein
MEINDDEERTWLLDNDPAKLLPFSKRLLPEDPEVETLPRAHVPNHPALFSENYS